MLQAKEVTQILRAHGYKVTPQRLAVYHALARTTAHPQAETLYAELLPLYPTMSLATVYKTLGILCEVGLAQELNVGEDAYRYDANTAPHPHICCRVCGRVDDVSGLSLTGLQREAASCTGYEVTEQQVYFYGVCPACREQELRDEAGQRKVH